MAILFAEEYASGVYNALQVLHAAQCYHRDISPDNILITDSGPMLLDFGAARRVIGDVQRALTVVLKPGFAPIEQYGDTPGMHQGAWTDVYALAAVVYFAIMGKTPPPSVGRLLKDNYQPLVEAAAGRYSERFLAAIDRVIGAAKKRNKFSGIHMMSTAALLHWMEQGMTLNLWSNDVLLMMNAAKEGLKKLKR